MNYVLNPKTQEAYDLFHEGALALTRCEQQGMRVDLEYIKKQQKKVEKKIQRLENEFKETEFYRKWEKSLKGKINIYSPDQLREFLYNVEKYPVEKFTDKGNPSTDAEALQELDIIDLEPYLKISKLKTLVNTFLASLEREVVDGRIHPFFHLHLVTSYRSCLAKGTKVLVMRDFTKNGIPIEDVKVGDFVYCFNNKLKPDIRKVLWAGKTGYRKVVRLHWSSKGKHGIGFLDCTPEHKIRLIDGTYVEAQNLINSDFRNAKEKRKRYAKIRTLSCFRNQDTLNFTGHLKNGTGVLEHRLIYKKLIGKLDEKEVVHHINGNHWDHSLSNLQKMSMNEHASLHVEDTLNSKQARRNNIAKVKKLWRKGRYKNAVKSGFDNGHSLRLSKYQVLKLLFKTGGKVTKINHDFNTFKDYLDLYKIDIKKVKILFDKNGKYISKTRFNKLQISCLNDKNWIREIIGHNFYKYKELEKYYDEGNHIITKIEWLEEKVDVYDLEIEGTNNFFANEICVHNSSSDPNFQNFPKRDEEQMQIIRGAIFPSKGHQLLELDYSQLEVRIAATYHKDPTMLKYIRENHDMHGDMAQQIFMLKKYDPKIPGHKILRGAAKNGFVFPAFYGDYHVGFAKGLASYKWGQLPRNNTWTKKDGIQLGDATLGKHMIKKGIDHLGLPTKDSYASGFTKHLKDIEQHFWNKRFPVYNQWREDFYQEYLKNGYFWSHTGFTYQGPMTKKDCINYPVQGAAFHILLWALKEAMKVQVRERWKSRIIGQIHDAIVIDAHPDELDHVIKVMKCIMVNDVVQHWKWINVPLEIEAELCPVNMPWSSKKEYQIN